MIIQSILPFCLREVWVITACLALLNATAANYKDGLVAPDVEKEFYRLQGDLFSLCRVKVNFSQFLRVWIPLMENVSVALPDNLSFFWLRVKFFSVSYC